MASFPGCAHDRSEVPSFSPCPGMRMKRLRASRDPAGLNDPCVVFYVNKGSPSHSSSLLLVFWEVVIDAIVAWDMEDDPQGNVQHIAQHGITMEEVEEVLLDEKNPVGESRSSGRPITIGGPPRASGSPLSGNKP